MATNGAQATYEWAQPGAENDLALQLEEISSQISELEFRAQFLARPEEQQQPTAAEAVAEGREFNAQGVYSEVAKAIIVELTNIAHAIGSTLSLPGLGPIQSFILKAIDQLAAIVNSIANGVSTAVLALTTRAVLIPLKALSVLSGGLLPPTIATQVSIVIDTLGKLATCDNKAMNVPSSMMDKTACYDIADLYRATVTNVLAGTILQIIPKNSIAASNEAPLDSRPVFAGDLLDQYRIEMVRAGAKDDVQKFAAGSLGLVVSTSSALEACLRIADSIAAVEDLNEELDGIDDEEDEADEDEDADEAAQPAP
ncbi:hypothetical protein BGX33_002006 [Mortierella sp. NVP41]|nr:hypothetical protein BGX33_002006 [Mortierella sp. NVP41]